MSPSRKAPLNFEALADFRYAVRRYLIFSEGNARKAGLEPQQYQALLAIKALRNPHDATIGVLAERLQIQHHSAVELMDRLEKHKLIRRHRSRADRRKVIVELTKRGESKLARVSQPQRSALQTAGRTLLRALERFISHNGPSSSSPRRRRKNTHAQK